MSAKKVLLGLAVLSLLGLIGVGVVLAILVPRYVEREVIAQAKERGLELSPGEIAFGWGWVQVSKAKAKLIGVRSLSASFEIADATLDGTKPLSFALSDLKLEAVGSPLLVRDELWSWARTYEKRTTEPVSVTGLTFTLRPEAGAQLPDLALSGGKLTMQSGRLRLDAERASLRGQALGPIRLSRDAEKAALAVTLGQSSLDNPLLALEYRDGEQSLVHAALSPISAGNLSRALGVGLPRPEVVVSGSADLQIPKNLLVGGQLTGRVDFTLKGYVPPHPIELDGFVFGDTTEVGAALKLEPERLRVLISDAKVKAGRFELVGGGELRAEGRQGRLTLSLRGELPCNALAGVVAETRLGKALGIVGGKAARIVVGGGVGVRVSVDLSTDNPEAARVVKTITAGCGLRPLSFEELVKLGELAPSALDPAVMADLKRLLEEGVAPPPPGSALPNLNIPGLGDLGLPTLPGFEINKPSGGSGAKTSKELAPASGGASPK